MFRNRFIVSFTLSRNYYKMSEITQWRTCTTDLEHGVEQEADGDLLDSGGLLLVLRQVRQPRLRGQARQQPAQLGVARHRRLHEQRAALRPQPRRQRRRRRLQRARLQLARLLPPALLSQRTSGFLISHEWACRRSLVDVTVEETPRKATPPSIKGK